MTLNGGDVLPNATLQDHSPIHQNLQKSNGVKQAANGSNGSAANGTKSAGNGAKTPNGSTTTIVNQEVKSAKKGTSRLTKFLNRTKVKGFKSGGSQQDQGLAKKTSSSTTNLSSSQPSSANSNSKSQSSKTPQVKRRFVPFKFNSKPTKDEDLKVLPPF